MELPEYTEKTGHQTRTTRTYIPIYDMNRECARFARLIILVKLSDLHTKFNFNALVVYWLEGQNFHSKPGTRGQLSGYFSFNRSLISSQRWRSDVAKGMWSTSPCLRSSTANEISDCNSSQNRSKWDTLTLPLLLRKSRIISGSGYTGINFGFNSTWSSSTITK